MGHLDNFGFVKKDSTMKNRTSLNVLFIHHIWSLRYIFLTDTKGMDITVIRSILSFRTQTIRLASFR